MSDSLRFLWEIFQNADDAAYPRHRRPEIKLTLTQQQMYIWYNEDGFSAANVESICRIGSSTKVGDHDTTGEKGIGFKSVFGVADLVTIHSGNYHFKFESAWLKGLGMLIPRWVNGPHALPEDVGDPLSGTLIELQFRAGFDVEELSSFLNDFDYTFLLFSRKLRTVSISNLSCSPSINTTGRAKRGRPISQIEISTEDDSHCWQFYSFKSKVVGLWDEKFRPDQKSSPIRLAFPFEWLEGQSGRACPQSCPTFAHFPIREYGFEVGPDCCRLPLTNNS